MEAGGSPCYRREQLTRKLYIQIMYNKLRMIISTKLNILQDHSTVLPRAVICGMQELKGTDNIKPLLDARNKLNEFLPEGETEDEE